MAEKIESNNRNYRDMSDVPWSLRILFILRALQFIFAKFMVSLEDRLETATKDINYSFNQYSCFGKRQVKFLFHFIVPSVALLLFSFT